MITLVHASDYETSGKLAKAINSATRLRNVATNAAWLTLKALQSLGLEGAEICHAHSCNSLGVVS